MGEGFWSSVKFLKGFWVMQVRVFLGLGLGNGLFCGRGGKNRWRRQAGVVALC